MTFRDQLLIVFEKLDKGFISDSSEPGHRLPLMRGDGMAGEMVIPKPRWMTL